MFEQTFRNIDNVPWKEAGCSSELDYLEQTSWLLFLKYLDGFEENRAMEAKQSPSQALLENYPIQESLPGLCPLIVAST